ncbi:MAG: transposase [Algibacter sp.]
MSSKISMSSDALFSAAHLLLPEVLVKYFDMIKYEIKEEEIHFYFTESNTVPDEFKEDNLNSKGFFPQATVQDFPIRGKNVFLHITRRRWFNNTKDKTSALIRLAKWDEKVRQAQFKSFNSISRTMSIHYKNILNYFENRSTNGIILKSCVCF